MQPTCLDAAKGRLAAPQRARHAFQRIEQAAIHHGHLVNNQVGGRAPALQRVAAGGQAHQLVYGGQSKHEGEEQSKHELEDEGGESWWRQQARGQVANTRQFCKDWTTRWLSCLALNPKGARTGTIANEGGALTQGAFSTADAGKGVDGGAP